jgi:hypothetical protein
MNEEQEAESKTNGQKWATERLLAFITVCPQIVKSGTGVEAFVKELNEAATKFDEYPLEIKGNIGTMSKLMPFITICPHIFKPGIGLVEFVRDMGEAASKFKLYFPEEEP